MARAASPRLDANGLASLYPGGRLRRARQDVLRLLRVGTTVVAVYAPRPGRARATAGARLRETFERLGLTYLKLGQYLAMRYDLLPAEVCRELEKLFEEVPAVPFEQVRDVIERELGRPLDELYASFDEDPLAAASVGQVHVARLHGGERVAVKIQRPGIESLFASDVRNMRRLAALADRFSLAGGMSVRELTDDFAAWTLRELDFRNEADTAIRLRRSAQDFERVPWIDLDRSDRRVMTMEFIDGVSLREIGNTILRDGTDDAIRERLPRFDLDELLHQLGLASFHQLFRTGFFHGDPHPGNILVTPENEVAFIDFGIYGSLTRYHRELMMQMIESLANGDVHGAFRSYAEMCDATDQSDADAFEREVKGLLGQWHAAAGDPEAPVEDRHLGRYTGEMLEVTRRHRMRMGFDTLLFWRAIVSVDSVTQQHPEHYDLRSELQDFFMELRGGPSERVSRVLANGPRGELTRTLAREGGVTAAAIMRELFEGTRSAVVTEREDRRSQRAENRVARAVGVALSLTAVAMALPHLGL